MATEKQIDIVIKARNEVGAGVQSALRDVQAGFKQWSGPQNSVALGQSEKGMLESFANYRQQVERDGLRNQLAEQEKTSDAQYRVRVAAAGRGYQAEAEEAYKVQQRQNTATVRGYTEMMAEKERAQQEQNAATVRGYSQMMSEQERAEQAKGKAALSSYRDRVAMEDRLYAATHSRQQVALQQHDDYYSRLKAKHAGNAAMLATIDQTYAAERVKILQGEGGGGWGGRALPAAGKILLNGGIAAALLRGGIAAAGFAGDLANDPSGNDSISQALREARATRLQEGLNVMGFGLVRPASEAYDRISGRGAALERATMEDEKTRRDMAGQMNASAIRRQLEERASLLGLDPIAAQREAALQRKGAAIDAGASAAGKISDLAERQRQNDQTALAAEALYARELVEIDKKAAMDRLQEQTAADSARVTLREEGFARELALLSNKHRMERAAYAAAARDQTELVKKQAAEESAVIEQQARHRKDLLAGAEMAHINAYYRNEQAARAAMELRHETERRKEAPEDQAAGDARRGKEKAGLEESFRRQTESAADQVLAARAGMLYDPHERERALLAIRQQAERRDLEGADMGRREMVLKRQELEREALRRQFAEMRLEVPVIERGFLTTAPGQYRPYEKLESMAAQQMSLTAQSLELLKTIANNIGLKALVVNF